LGKRTQHYIGLRQPAKAHVRPPAKLLGDQAAYNGKVFRR